MHTNSSVQFEQYDVVKVIRLNQAERSIQGSEGVMRQPRIGDTGTIVEILGEESGQELLFIIECVDSEGYTIWLADFTADEIERLPLK